MNKCEIAAAMQAWTMAINHKLALPEEITDIQELAYQYGRATSTPEHIDQISHMFNWNNLMEIIEDAV